MSHCGNWHRKRKGSDNRLDECEGADAQSEIIRITASTISDNSLPLCWAFFSRPEPQIEATFRKATVAPHCDKITPPHARLFLMHLDRYLPDKIINLIDEAVLVLRLAQESKADEVEVLERDTMTLTINLASL